MNEQPSFGKNYALEQNEEMKRSIAESKMKDAENGVELKDKERKLVDPQGMIPVKSSNIEYMGFNPTTKQLTVQFKGGKQYQYKDVNQDKFERMQQADSIGKFIHAEIKGFHDCECIS